MDTLDFFENDSKSKTYDEILLLKSKLDSDPDWVVVEDSSVYDGKSMDDITYATTYFNSGLNKAIEIFINISNKCAYAQEVNVNDLKDNNTQKIPRKLK